MTQPRDVDVEGLPALLARTHGDSSVVVAVIDGWVDADHPCFAGSRLIGGTTDADLLAHRTAMHGTYVASVIAGSEGSPVEGLAPGCTVLSIPLWTPDRPRPSQVDIARAIEEAIEAGAHIINISGGQYSDTPDAQDHLERAVQACIDADVLLVAAAGNDGCECLHVPAALEGVLAVGSHGGTDGSDFSNYHDAYFSHGLTAPGEEVTGAVPGGDTVTMSGTSVAAPIVSAAAALLVSLRRQQNRDASPRQIGHALLQGAAHCDLATDHCQRLLGRTLTIEGALNAMDHPTEQSQSAPSCGCGGAQAAAPVAEEVAAPVMAAAAVVEAPMAPVSFAPSAPVLVGAQQSGFPVTNDDALVYALGSLSFDFGTEARRDSFKQLMAPAIFNGVSVPANPYDSRQLVEHLRQFPSEARSLIWTLNLELTPIYAIEAVGPYAGEVNAILVDFLADAGRLSGDSEFIERISVPGHLSERSVRLFSGQVVPVLEVDTPRGLYGWQVNRLINDAVNQLELKTGPERDLTVETLRTFLDRVYYEVRNLGRMSADRAINFAATNAFQAARVFAQAVTSGMRLDTIEVESSPFARPDSDAWDVKLKFFDPDNLRRARTVFRFTIDVSDVMPVTIGEVRSWSVSS